jgi:hypothetical protein
MTVDPNSLDKRKGMPPEDGLIDVDNYAQAGETASVPMPDKQVTTPLPLPVGQVSDEPDDALGSPPDTDETPVNPTGH